MEKRTLILIALCIAGLSYCVKFASSSDATGTQTCGSVSGSTAGNNCNPLTAPRNVTVTNKTSKALLINWTHVDHSELLGYRVRFNRNITCDSAGNYTNCSFSIFLCKNITSIWLEDLKIYTDYWIEVVAFKYGNFSENDTTLVARTDEGVPSQPPVIEAAANHSSTSISVTWKSIPEKHRRGRIKEYTVTVAEAETGIFNRTIVANWGNNSIKIHGLRKYTLYNVTVSASTGKGASSESKVHQIRTAEDAPDGAPILDTDATEVTQHSFVVSWGLRRQSLNGILRKYKIRWRKVDSADYHNETLILESHHSRRRRDITIPSNRTSFELKNLSLYTNYSVEIAAVTIKEGNYGSPKYFMTGEGAPTSPPLNVTAHNTSSTSIFVTWSPPPSDNIPGILLGYEVFYTPSEPEESHNSSTIRRVMLCSCNTSIELTNLTVYESYNITVAAFTSAGIGNESEIIQTKTDEEEPKEAPQNVSAVSETFDSINVTWRPVPEEKRDGIIILYQVNITDGSFTKSNTTSKLTIEIQGLEMFEMYSVRVRAFTRIGEGPFSNPTKLKTKEEAPWFAPKVTGHAFNRTAINVTWDIVLPKGFKLRGFNVTYGWQNVTYRWQNVTYRWQNVTYRWQNETVRVNEPERTVVLTGLEVSTEYEIKVAAATNYEGNYSQAILVKTGEGAPSGSPTNVDAVAKSISSINVTWERVPKLQRNGNVTMYDIHVMNGSHYVANISVCANNFSVVVDKLEMFVTYYVRVRALTAVGFGPWSRNVTVATNQTAPKIVLNVTASVINETSIRASWQIGWIHPRLQTPDTYQVSYCPHCPRKTCLETNISTSSGYQTTLVSRLLVGVTYNITVRAINVTARDGTHVETPYGSYSEPVYNTTHEGAPEVPPNVTASPLTTTSINVSWSKIPCNRRGGKIIKYFIEIHNSSGKILEKQVSGNDSSYEVTGLEVYSNYSARVSAGTGADNSSFSDFYNTTTHQPAPKTIPPKVEAVATGSTSILVTWTEITNDNFLTGYTVKYTENTERVVVRFKKVKGVGELELQNLKIFTNYTIEVAARSSTQDGNFSKAIRVTTLEDVPGAAPTNVYVQILGSTLAKVNWGKVPEKDQNGIIKGYRVRYTRIPEGTRRRRSAEDYKEEKISDGDTTSLVLQSLYKAGKYKVEVLAFTGKGDGNFSTPKRFRTADDVPSKSPVKLTAVNRLSPSTISVTWEPVPNGYMHGKLQNYKVVYRKAEVGDVRIEEEPEVIIVSGNQTSVELKGLEPYVRYSITVAARTTIGYGPPSASVSGETCHCKQKFSTSWRRYEPYANVTEDSEPGQIIPVVLQSMVDECCGNCSAYERVRLDFKKNGKDGPALRNSSRELLESLDEKTDFTFPVYGFNEQDRYKGGYGYIPVIESAGVAFIVYPQKSSNQNTMYDLMISCLPVLVLPIITACVSGMIIWGLERASNSKDFPVPFLQGTWEGIWWAFVSMTTLGYGDRAPLSGKGRLFAIVWILFGLVIIALTMAMLTTALTAVAVKEEYKLYGTKIAAEYNSPEYNLGTRRNAKFDKDKHYNNIDEVAQALINKEVDGILVDSYAAGLRGDLFNRPELLVSKIIDYKSAYGIVFSSSTNRLRKCFRRYMVSHKAEIFEMVKKNVKPIETTNSTTSSEEQAGGILDNDSPQFRKGLNYAIVCFGIALLLSLTYEVIRRLRKRHKVHQQVQFKTKLQAEMSQLVEEFMQRTKKIKQRLGEKHRQQVVKFWKLQRKGSTTNNWLRISQVSPHPSEVIITDYNC